MKKTLEGLKQLMEEHQGMVTKLSKIKERNAEELEQDRITRTVAVERINDHLDESNYILSRRSQELSELLQEDKEQTIQEAMAKLTKTVTADEVAELQLLNQLTTITREDLFRYADKYQDKPLALKYIDGISKDRDIVFSLSEEQLDLLDPEKAINELAQDIGLEIRQYNSIRELDVAEHTQYELIVEGKIENIQKELDKLD